MADKFKKISREFKLSDSTVNCYGFRLMTNGYQMDGYGVNPIGFYMHKRDDGVAVKWENLRVDGDSIYGTPVVNLSNPKGQQIVDEIENGFLNAASMGEFVVLDYTMDEDMMLPNQTGPTVTKWYNRETSVVDIPGNNNALVQLFDKGGNAIKLADLMAGHTASKAEGDVTENFNYNFNMKKVTLTLSAGLYSALGLAADAAPNVIEGSLDGLVAKAGRADQLEIDKVTLTNERDSWKSKFEHLQGSTVKLQVTEMLEKALSDKKITQKLHDLYAVDYATEPAKLKAVLAGHGSYLSLTDTINNGGNAKTPEGLEGKTWDDLYAANKLPGLKSSNYAYYKELHKGKFGKYPEE